MLLQQSTSFTNFFIDCFSFFTYWPLLDVPRAFFLSHPVNVILKAKPCCYDKLDNIIEIMSYTDIN